MRWSRVLSGGWDVARRVIAQQGLSERMQRVLLTILLVASLVAGVHWYTREREVLHAAGVLAEAEPTITPASDMASWRDAHGFSYRALGRFGGRVIVVSRTNYSIGEFARLAPTDLAIVWGPLSDIRAYSQLEFDQRGSPLAGRFVFPQIRPGTTLAQRPVADVRAYLLANLTHVHTIAADHAIAARLATIRPGQLVRFSGVLVDVTAPSGTRYTSSTTLHDYDCEIAWIDELELIDRGVR